MTADEYILRIIHQKSVIPVQLTDPRLAKVMVRLREWAGSYLNEIKLSGSSAKGVVVQGQPDTDIFISLRSDTPGSLEHIYNSLADALKVFGKINRRTVALNTVYNGLQLDLVPGRVQPGYRNYHSLYNSETGTWLQTNVEEHIKLIRKSGRENEIRALKIWARIRNIKFPSLYLELLILDALYWKSKSQLAINVIAILEFLRDNIVDRRVTDPVNSNNILSDYMLSQNDKRLIERSAKNSLKESSWGGVLW